MLQCNDPAERANSLPGLATNIHWIGVKFMDTQTITEKRCSRCKTIRPVAVFCKTKSNSNGLSSQCRSCRRACQSAKYARYKAETKKPKITSQVCPTCRVDKPVSAFHKKAASKFGITNECKQCVSHKGYQRYQRKREAMRVQANAQRYLLTAAEYTAMFERQRGLCAICGNPQRGRITRLSVDHDHKTGKVRELLCSLCNRGLGWFRENPSTIQAAIAYLEKHKTPI